MADSIAKIVVHSSEPQASLMLLVAVCDVVRKNSLKTMFVTEAAGANDLILAGQNIEIVF